MLVSTGDIVLCEWGNDCIYAHLFLGKARPDTNYIGNIPLDNTDIGQVLSPKSLQVFALPLSLLLLLSQTLMAECKSGSRVPIEDLLCYVLLCSNGFELDSFVCVDSSACRTSLVEIFFDVMPTETTNLFGR